MHNLIQYGINVTIAWSVFLAIYLIFLRKETFFRTNRLFLVHSLWIGAVIPLLNYIPFSFSKQEGIIMDTVIFISEGTTLASTPLALAEASTNLFSWEQLLLSVYLLGAMVVMARFILGLLRIRKIYLQGEKLVYNNYTVVLSDQAILPFSFMDKVFFHRSYLENSHIQEILHHELTHIKYRHTYDVLFVELVSILFWWNPFIYLYKKEIKQNHEYIADAYASDQTHTENYGQILLGHSSSGLELALTNQFFNSHLKKRINMLYKEKSAKYRMSRYLLVVPLVLFLSILFSFKSDVISEGNDMRLMILHDSSVLEVGETYDFKVFNYDTSEKLSFELSPSLGGYVFDDVKNIQPIDGVYHFAISPNEPTVDGEKMTVKVFQSNSSASLEFSIIGEAEEKEDNTSKNAKNYLYYHNGKKLDKKPEGEFSLDGSVVMTTGVEEIKKRYKIEVTEDVTVIDFLGGITKDEGTDSAQANDLVLVKASDDTGPLKIGNAYAFTLKSLSGSLSRDVKISLSNSEQALVELVDNSWTENSVDLMVVPKKLTLAGEPLYLICEVGAHILRTELTIEKRATPVQKKEVVHVSERSFYTETMSDPLIVINGEISETDQEHYFTESKVKNVKVLEAPKAILKYGDRGANGALEITLSERSHPVAKWNGDEEIFKVVEEMPRFPGCEDQGLSDKERVDCAQGKMLEFMYKNLKYPASARASNIEGMVVIQFVVNEDGRLSDITLRRAVGGGCDEAALDMIQSMADLHTWIPGKQRGKAVKVLYTVPVKFKLKDEGESSNIKEESSIFFMPGSFKGCPDPAFIINGKFYDSEIEDNSLKTIGYSGNLDPENIEKVSVYFNEFPEEWIKYKDRCGLFIITLKEGISEEYSDEEIVTLEAMPVPSPNEFFKVVEEMPRFPGCEDLASAADKSNCAKEKLLEWIYSNLNYPKDGVDGDLEGMQVVQFVVRPDGKVTDIKIVRSVGSVFDASVMQLMNKMADDITWIAGKQRGKKVPVQFTLPIKFKLDKAKMSVSVEDAKQSSIQTAIKNPNASIEILGNPVTDGFLDYVYTTDIEGEILVEIFNIKGDRVKHNTWSSRSKLTTIQSLVGVPAGEYILSAKQGKSQVTKKFIVL